MAMPSWVQDPLYVHKFICYNLAVMQQDIICVFFFSSEQWFNLEKCLHGVLGTDILLFWWLDRGDLSWEGTRICEAADIP